MISISELKPLVAVLAAALVVALLLAGCFSSVGSGQQAALESPQIVATATDIWASALSKTPYPYTLALPEPMPTLLDGTYAKFELKETPPVHCLRCPDYAPEGGVWKLQLDRGVFRIFHQPTGWHSMGSYILSKDRRTAGTVDQLVLFNDPNCPEYVGVYAWQLDAGQLRLKAIEDTCSIHLRAMNLSNLPWLACRPPNIEAGTTDHWPKPPGCE